MPLAAGPYFLCFPKESKQRKGTFISICLFFFNGIDERFAVPKALLRTGKTTAKISACVARGNSVLIS